MPKICCGSRFRILPDRNRVRFEVLYNQVFRKWVKITSVFTLCQTALHVASEHGKANSMAALLEWGADVDAQETWSKNEFFLGTDHVKLLLKG